MESVRPRVRRAKRRSKFSSVLPKSIVALSPMISHSFTPLLPQVHVLYYHVPCSHLLRLWRPHQFLKRPDFSQSSCCPALIVVMCTVPLLRLCCTFTVGAASVTVVPLAQQRHSYWTRRSPQYTYLHNTFRHTCTSRHSCSGDLVWDRKLQTTAQLSLDYLFDGFFAHLLRGLQYVVGRLCCAQAQKSISRTHCVVRP